MMSINTYKCSKCGVLLERTDTRKWIKSFCGDTGKDARLILIDRRTLMFGIEVVFYDRNGYWSKSYTYLSNEPYEKDTVVIVPKGEFFSVGKVKNCVSNPKLKDGINYKYITCRADV